MTSLITQESPDQLKMIKRINKHLNSSQTRLKGLVSLQQFLCDCADAYVIEYCITWMQQCFKNDFNDLKSMTASMKVLKQLLLLSASFPELHKSVSNFISTRFFDPILKYLSNLDVAWSCAETCFTFYNGPCGPHVDAIEENLLVKIKKDERISLAVAHCYALVPGLGGGGLNGINHKTNWRNQFLKIIDVCHSIFNELFKGIEELQVYDSHNESYSNGENSATYLTVQLYNHCLILQCMLLDKFPVAKCVSAVTVLTLICRGLAVTPNTLGNNVTSELIALRSVLPEVTTILHITLDSLITASTTHLLPYSLLICKLIRQTLQWTESGGVYSEEKIFARSRVAAYTTLINWLMATRSGGSADKISPILIPAIVNDIQLKKPSLHLKSSQSIRALKEDQVRPDRRVTTGVNAKLCHSALKTGQLYLKCFGHLLKPQEQSFLQKNVISLLLEIQTCSSPATVPIPYGAKKCRQELYLLLLSLTQNPCPKWPPPTQFALRIFSKAQVDPCLQISETCVSALNSIMNIVHSEFAVATFPKSLDADMDADLETRGRANHSVNLTWRQEGRDVSFPAEQNGEHEGQSALQVSPEEITEICSPDNFQELPIDLNQDEGAKSLHDSREGEKNSPGIGVIDTSTSEVGNLVASGHKIKEKEIRNMKDDEMEFNEDIVTLEESEEEDECPKKSNQTSTQEDIEDEDITLEPTSKKVKITSPAYEESFPKVSKADIGTVSHSKLSPVKNSNSEKSISSDEDDKKKSEEGIKDAKILLTKISDEILDTKNASPSKRYFLRSKPNKDQSEGVDDLIMLRSGPKLRQSLKPEKHGSVSSDSSSVRSGRNKAEKDDDDIMKSFDESLNSVE